MQNTFKIKF